MGDAREMLVSLPDGRALEVLTAGPVAATALVYHHGTPLAAALFQPLVAAAAAHGLRTLSYSRPGYAGSTAKHGRSVADAVTDVAAILDALGVEKFYALGWSGGGPHALACAALLPERCVAASSLAGVAPYAADGLDWLDGMAAENREEFGLVLEGESALTPWLEREAQKLMAIEGPDVAAALGGLVSDVDQAALTGEFAEFSALSLRRGVSTGIAGWRDDDLAFAGAWGFDLEAIQTPVAIWQGGEDRMVPFAHGAWLADHIPHALRRLHPREGHLSLGVARIREIVDDLVAIES